jgi:alkyl hydroperoxide reductase subunit F
MQSLIEDIVSVSDKVTWSKENNERTPSFAIVSPEVEASVRFAGLPLGHEFTSLVLALLHVGGHPPKVDDDTINQIKSLSGDFNFEVYFSLTCQNCPDVVQGLNTIAALNSDVKVTSIDGSLFKEEVDAREVMSVPMVFLNGEVFSSGRMDLQQILAKLDTGAEARMAEEIKEKDAFDVLIVGGGPAGAASAVYAARKGIRTGVAAERFGGQVLDTMDIENLISVPHTDGPKLSSALEAHVGEYDVDVMNLQTATGLIPAKQEGGLHTVELSTVRVCNPRLLSFQRVPGGDKLACLAKRNTKTRAWLTALTVTDLYSRENTLQSLGAVTPVWKLRSTLQV